MTNSYGIGGIGGYDPSLMSNPYFLAALQSYNPYNPSFQGAQQNTAAQQAVDPTIALQTSETAAATPNPAFKAAPQEESGNGLLVGGALAAITAIGVGAYAAKRGNGEGIIKGFKNILESIKGNAKPTKEMRNFTFRAKDGSHIVVEKGKVVSIKAMGEETVIDNNIKALNYIRKEKITVPKSPIDATSKKLAKGIGLNNFEITYNGKKYLVENGEIVKAFDRSGQEIKGKTIDEILAGDKDKVTGKITKIMNGEAKIDAKSINGYTWTDSTGRAFTINKNHTVTKIVIPAKRGAALSEAEQKAWLNRNSDIDKQVQELISKGRSEGVKVDLNIFTDLDGNKLAIDANGEISAIVLKKKPKTGPQVLRKGSTEFDAWLYDHKEVKEAVEREVKTGLAGEKSRFVAA